MKPSFVEHTGDAYCEIVRGYFPPNSLRMSEGAVPVGALKDLKKTAVRFRANVVELWEYGPKKFVYQEELG